RINRGWELEDNVGKVRCRRRQLTSEQWMDGTERIGRLEREVTSLHAGRLEGGEIESCDAIERKGAGDGVGIETFELAKARQASQGHFERADSHYGAGGPGGAVHGRARDRALRKEFDI